MKKILLSLGVFTSISLSAQSINILNPGFEGAFTTINPQSLYYSILPYQNSSLTQGWNLVANGNVDVSTKTEGNQSVRLVTGDDPELAKIYNEAGTPGTDVTGLVIQGIKGKIDNPGQLKLSFDYKYSNVGVDSAYVFIAIQDTLLAGSGDNKTLYQGALNIDATVSNWKSHTITPTFINQGDANRVLIIAISSKNGYINKTAPVAGSTLWLDNFKLDVTSALDENVISDLKVYPNPATDVLKFETAEEIESVVISSIEGKVVREVKESSNINVSDLKAGVYVYRVKTRLGKQSTANFIKE